MRWFDHRDRRARARGFGRALLALGVAGYLAIAAASRTLAATPSPTTQLGGDPRSSGQGPGLVGDPLLAITIVVGIGLIALAATLLYVRMTGGPRAS